LSGGAETNADAYSFPIFSSFFGFIAKACPEPSFFNPQAFQPPKGFFCFFLYILVHVNPFEWKPPKDREPLLWTDQPMTNDQQPTTNDQQQTTNDQQPKTNNHNQWPMTDRRGIKNTAKIGHGGIYAPLTICWKCGKTWPSLAADRLAAPLRRC
jgi:hypothetical protein